MKTYFGSSKCHFTLFNARSQDIKTDLVVTYIRRYLPHLLASDTRHSNGFSQVYILITWIPLIISPISRTRSSVLVAILPRNFDAIFPTYTETNIFIVIDWTKHA